MINEQNFNLEIEHDKKVFIVLKKIFSETLGECEKKYFQLIGKYDIVVPTFCDKKYNEPYKFVVIALNEKTK